MLFISELVQIYLNSKRNDFIYTPQRGVETSLCLCLFFRNFVLVEKNVMVFILTDCKVIQINKVNEKYVDLH